MNFGGTGAGSVSSSSTRTTVPPSPITKPPMPTHITTPNTGFRCFNCGEPGHRFAECKKGQQRGLFLDIEEINREQEGDVEVEPIYDEEERLEVDVGPMLMIRRNCLAPRVEVTGDTPRGENNNLLTMAKFEAEVKESGVVYVLIGKMEAENGIIPSSRTFRTTNRVTLSSMMDSSSKAPSYVYLSVVSEPRSFKNCTEKDILVGDKLKSWDKKLGQAEFAHNYVVNRSTKLSPFKIVYGFLPRCPLDLANLPNNTKVNHKAEDFVTQLQDIHNLTRENLLESIAKFKHDADHKRRLVNFEIGPVEIIEKINSNAYRLKLPSHLRTTDVFNVKHWFPFHGDLSSEEEDLPNSWSNSSQLGEDDVD
uniref:CCHC-type domain-containing protein n=1 Tax=Populus alba TaxID=43335 RepID=A0A4U5QCA9_POPAL|nr:hypothetical protein D5086_0000106940 [Populus alba]